MGKLTTKLPFRSHPEDVGIDAEARKDDATDAKPADSPGVGSIAKTSQSLFKRLRRPRSSQASFFSLPLEVRNEIYPLVADETSLTLVHGPNARQIIPQGLIFADRRPGLLLACRQSRNEFGPYLWSRARIVVNIQGFDFRPVISMTGSLFSSRLKAMRANKRLVLRMHLDKVVRQSHAPLLRRWLNHRHTCLDLLPWSYEVAPNSQSPKQRARCLRSYLDLEVEGVETEGELNQRLSFELGPILSCIEDELRSTELILSSVK